MLRIIALGGGDMRLKTTLKIDEYAAGLAKTHAGENRAYGLYVGTASHDFMPAFNTFRKTYTSVLDIKSDCALTVYVKTPEDKLDEKFLKADLIYIGGGDTLFMLDEWKSSGLLSRITSAGERGVTIIGRSAGAICWFEDMYTDTEIIRGTGNAYSLNKGLGVIKGLCCPHYNKRRDDFLEVFKNSGFTCAYGIEDDAALEFADGKLVKSLTSGGKAYLIEKVSDGGEIGIIEKEI